MNSRATAIGISITVHALLILIALLIKFRMEAESQYFTLSVNPANDQITELLTIKTDLADALVDAPQEKEADVAIDGFSDPVFDLNVLSLPQSGGDTNEGDHSQLAKSGNSNSDWTLTSHRVAAVLDASQDLSGAMFDEPTERGHLISRDDVRSEVAHEIARISPGKIFSVVFVPMKDLGSTPALKRRHVIEWATGHRYDWTELATVTPTPDLVILASDDRYPMAELREIIGGKSTDAPMLVIGLQLERSDARELKKLANDCGGAYFGIDQ